MTFERLVAAHARALGGMDALGRAEEALLEFLDWETANDGALSDTVRIMLLSADFSTELTTAVIWLNKRGLDVSCFRLRPHRLGADVLIDIQQIIPLPEAADYEVKLRAQQQEAQRVVSVRADIFRRFWAQLIERSKPRTNVVAGRSTSAEHWLTGTIGRTGFQPTFTMKQLDSRVEMYIDLGKGAEQRTKSAFQALALQRDDIERAFGGTLEWQPLPDKRGCRIYGVVDGGWKTPEGEWPELQDRFIDAMIRLVSAFRSHVTALTI